MSAAYRDAHAAMGERGGRMTHDAAIAALRRRGAMVFQCKDKRAMVPKASTIQPDPCPPVWNYWTSAEFARCCETHATGPAMGLVPSSLGLVVVDVDKSERGRPLDEAEPPAAYAEVQAVVSVLGEPLLSVRTAKRNRRHLYYRMAEPDRHVEYTGAGADKHARGEVRASKGYVVMHGDTAANLVRALLREGGRDVALTVAAVRAFVAAGETAAECARGARDGAPHRRRGEA